MTGVKFTNEISKNKIYQPIIKKLIEINEFEKKHPDFSWKVGADWPEGFDGE